MNDNDSIKRGDAKAALGQLTLYRAQIEGDNVFVIRYTEAYEALDSISAVPQEMSAREFVIAHHRMCQSGISCDECGITHDGEVPRSCAVLMGLNPDDTVAIVEKWAKEHPEEKNEE